MKVLKLEYKIKYKTDKIAEIYYTDDMLGCVRVNFGDNEDNFICIDFFDGSEIKLDENDKSVAAFSGSIVLDGTEDMLVDFLYDHVDDIENFDVETGCDDEMEWVTSLPDLVYLKLTVIEDGKIVNVFEWESEK